MSQTSSQHMAQNLPPTPEKNKVRVGIAVMIVKDGKILLGKRKGSHGAGEYAGPGGHLEHMESIEGCARRETLEEAGIEIENVRFLKITNLKSYSPKHFIEIGLFADWKAGEPRVLEPDRTENWDWYDLDALPTPIFTSIPNYIEAYKTGKAFFDE